MQTRQGRDSARPVVVRRVEQVRAAVSEARKAGRQVAFVPTMGALHAGHLRLIETAGHGGAFVVVSIYVNPTQFGPHEDYRRYPRTLEADRRACRRAGVGMIFTPTDEEIYPPGDQTRVRPGPLAEPLCGTFRPGHFEGVCTVVAKLLNIVQPDVAYFGQKDAQQAVVLRRMVRDLFMPVRIEVCPLVREPDGLALSSRNERLSEDDRRRSLRLYQALCLARDRLLGGERSIGPPNGKPCSDADADVLKRSIGRIIAAMRGVVAERGQVTIDYLSIVDPETLEPVARPRGRVMIAGAIRIGETRLIDNLLVDLGY